MELSEKQKYIVNLNEPHIAVMASAAAGKTRVLTERVRRMLRDGFEPTEIAVITFTNMAAQELKDRLAADYEPGMYIGTIHGLANRFLLRGGINTDKYIKEEEFDKFFELLKEHPQCVQHIPHILLDECQDISPLEYEFIFDMIKPDTFFIVGDLRQCQPAGTKVLMYDKTEKNIEDLEIGDKVISYSMERGHVFGGKTSNAINNRVLNINKRQLLDEELIKVTTEEGHISYYTPNHRTIANLCRFTEYNFLVYLMCDENNRFRIGTSQFCNSNNGAWRAKLRAEECTKIWILDTFKTNKEARVLEDKLSYLYQIPQVTFQLDKTTYTQDDINYIYEGLDTYTSASKCLKAFHRDINFPFSVKGDDNHYATNAFNITHACNLLPKNMKMLAFDPSDRHKKKGVNIQSIEYVDGNNIDVYSLDVENCHTYVADGLFTHNSIYHFRGGDSTLFQDLMDDPDVVVCSLNENYRNGSNILAYAKDIIKYDITDDSIPKRIGGFVYEGPPSMDNVYKWLDTAYSLKDWVILCTTNAIISTMMKQLKEHGIPCITFKQGRLDKTELHKLMQTEAVKVLTYHSAKGLEFPNVIAWEPRWWGDQCHELNYMAATRAIDSLYWCGKGPSSRKSKKKKKTIYFGE